SELEVSAERKKIIRYTVDYMSHLPLLLHTPNSARHLEKKSPD
ncbi:unnamed protein product, partial [Heterotrigona itama]